MERIRVEKNILYNDGYEIYIFDRENGTFANPITFEKHTPGMYHEPTAIINATAAQELMDSLWSAGVRPTEGSGSAGALAATQNHLKDMQKISFTFLERLK